MCGIAGFVDFNKKSGKNTLIQMTDTLNHRGPDDSGVEFLTTPIANIGLGHRRLSIIDVSSLGHQPMYSQNRNWCIVFNGEIYNYREIQHELTEKGYSFHSNSDTEVILNAFDYWGINAVERFVGMFSFSILNIATQQFYVFRDRAGIKPLYYTFQNGVFLFASELKALHKHSTFEKNLNIEAIGQFLQYGYIKAPLSIFENCYKLLPGHYLCLDLAKQTLQEHKYWSVYDNAYMKPIIDISEQEAIQETERLLRSAFEYRMVADVPVGVFLSGGYDSSAVTALLQTNRTDTLKTFSIGFQEKPFDEAPFAKKVAKHLGTQHTEYYCTTAEAKAIIPTLPYYFDEPFGDSSAIPTILVSQLARKSVTVALSADGGDEAFAGYNQYSHLLQIQHRLSQYPITIRRISSKTMSIIKEPERIPLSGLVYNFATRYQKMQDLLANNHILEYRNTLAKCWSDQQLRSLLLQRSNNAISFSDFSARQHSLSNLHTLLAIDYQSYMVDDILVKVDRATMSVGLEGREPLLDHRIIEWVAQLPTHLKCNNSGIKKYLLKKIVHKYLPQSLMDRPKMGFSIPITEWFKDDLRMYFEEYLSEDKIKKQGLFNYDVIKNLKNSYYNSQSANVNQLWYLLMFQMWHEKWLN